MKLSISNFQFERFSFSIFEIMNKSNHEQSNGSIRDLIENVAVKKHQELDPEPTKLDYQIATELMVKLFAQMKTRYFSEDEIIPSIKKFIKKDERLDRIGLKETHEIMSVLKEKRIVNEFHPKCIKKHTLGDIVLIDENKDQSGFFNSFIKYDSNLPVYRYATRDDLYMNKITTENNDESSEEDQNDLQTPD